MISIFHNLASIILGLIAWALPIAYLFVGKRRDLFCGGSFAVCALSLLFQLREVMHRTNIRDFSAIMDTINAVNFCVAVLLAVTLALNLITLARRQKGPGV